MHVLNKAMGVLLRRDRIMYSTRVAFGLAAESHYYKTPLEEGPSKVPCTYRQVVRTGLQAHDVIFEGSGWCRNW